MSNEKFTQDEWSVNNVGMTGDVFDVVFGDDEECVCEIVHEEADAHLIASAPDMYRMLERLSEYRSFQGVPAWTDEISKLLAKARGES